MFWKKVHFDYILEQQFSAKWFKYDPHLPFHLRDLYLLVTLLSTIQHLVAEKFIKIFDKRYRGHSLILGLLLKVKMQFWSKMFYWRPLSPFIEITPSKKRLFSETLAIYVYICLSFYMCTCIYQFILKVFN